MPLSLTARELIRKVANETSLSYKEVARLVNKAMGEGHSLLHSVKALAETQGLEPSKFTISSVKLVKEAKRILEEDYTQTLMISAVMAQMVESKGPDRLPIPAFFAFLELLLDVEEAPRDQKSETSREIDLHTTRMIELMTTLVSVVCDWSTKGISGVAKDCPSSLRRLAKAVFSKTKLFQNGIWTCVSCGKMVDVKDTRALMCTDCDVSLSSEITRLRPSSPTRDRLGYGQTEKSDSEE